MQIYYKGDLKENIRVEVNLYPIDENGDWKVNLDLEIVRVQIF